ncbi:SMI1/KNR4 family protein [Mucilaginibacter terrae]|uniref:Knr4/Smi1-like domain-containing protein n=1 Tax=Mucilaginibacter terrae TaxID=1955052 RepID=A0ABU3GVI1_9SPHI|nr:SMI1/KNR4 family protein [Mucilaginibacter terrae]MDT3403601.1 hypothetical protein [Mucilaginibacter terrae]
MELKIIIDQFFRLINFTNPYIYEALGDGLEESEIKYMEQSINFDFPEDLHTLYSIKNGLQHADFERLEQTLLFQNGLFLTLEDSIKEYEYLIFDFKLRKKLPIFDSGGGDFLLFDCDKKSSTYNTIVYYSPALLITTPQSIYDSMETLFSTNIRCFIDGVYKYDDTMSLEIAPKRLASLSKKMNPNSSFWEEYERYL